MANNQVTHNERVLLRQQMELLAKKSKDCSLDKLPAYSMAMVEIYKTLYWKPASAKDVSC